MTGRAAITPFVLLVVGGGLLIGFFTAPGPWYEALGKAFLQSAELAVRSGLDRPLCVDRHRRLAHLAARALGRGP